MNFSIRFSLSVLCFTFLLFDLKRKVVNGTDPSKHQKTDVDCTMDSTHCPANSSCHEQFCYCQLGLVWDSLGKKCLRYNCSWNEGKCGGFCNCTLYTVQLYRLYSLQISCVFSLCRMQHNIHQHGVFRFGMHLQH